MDVWEKILGTMIDEDLPIVSLVSVMLHAFPVILNNLIPAHTQPANDCTIPKFVTIQIFMHNVSYLFLPAPT